MFDVGYTFASGLLLNGAVPPVYRVSFRSIPPYTASYTVHTVMQDLGGKPSGVDSKWKEAYPNPYGGWDVDKIGEAYTKVILQF